MSKGLFIIGTGTDVGKTYITALLIKKMREAGYDTGYYKAAISGADSVAASDAGYVNRVAGIGEPEELLVSYLYPEAVSPHLAAQWSRRPLEKEQILRDYARVTTAYPYVTVEGSGGIVCPLREDDQARYLLADLIRWLQLPVLLVVRAGLGTINEAVLTIAYLRQQGLRLQGLIVNRYHGGLMEADNVQMLEKLTGEKVLAVVPEGAESLQMDAQKLAALYLARPDRPALPASRPEFWQQLDAQYVWHPAQQMKDAEVFPPVVIDHAEGLYLYDTQGKPYLDIISSWWCNLLGHCQPEISAAITGQLQELEHVIFANFSHRPALQLCEALAPLLPPGLCKFNFCDNGSAAVECALKLAFQYQYQIGQPQRQRFMCLSESYHGETIGALSVGGMDLYAKLYQPMLMDNIHFEGLDCYRCTYGKTRTTCSCECFASAEAAFARYGRETAAVIVEPILQGAAGMRIYPALYLQKLRALCDSYGVLLIADEIATGFGRTGKMFAVEHAHISPDIMCISKGLTGGFLPMAITITTQGIYDAFYGEFGEHKAFMHSHTYAGNPLGCAAAVAVLKVLQEKAVLAQAASQAVQLHALLKEALGTHPHVGEIRHIGLINALELVEDPRTKKAFSPERRIGWQIFRKAMDLGLVLRPIGDVIYFNPPLTIDAASCRKAVALCKQAVEEVLGC